MTSKEDRKSLVAKTSSSSRRRRKRRRSRRRRRWRWRVASGEWRKLKSLLMESASGAVTRTATITSSSCYVCFLHFIIILLRLLRCGPAYVHDCVHVIPVLHGRGLHALRASPCQPENDDHTVHQDQCKIMSKVTVTRDVAVSTLHRRPFLPLGRAL